MHAEDAADVREQQTTEVAPRFQFALLALAVLLIIVATGYSAFTAGKLRESVDWVTHTLQLQAQLRSVQSLNYSVDNYGLRYQLSHRDDYLQTHVETMFEVEAALQALGSMISDNPEQAARFMELRGLVAARDEFYRAAVGEAQTEGLSASAQRVRAGRGADLLNRMTALMAAMHSAEADLLRKRQLDLDAVIVQSTVTVLLVNALALVLGGVALVSLRRGARSRVEQQLAKVRAEEAERVSREKSAFLASMSHEIRTPMNAVFGFSQLLAKTRIEPQAQEYIRAIQTSGRALLALINDILDLSKIEAGKLDLAPQSTDVRELLDSTVAVFSEAANSKGLALKVRISPSLPRCLMVDPHRLRQVLINLLSNAVKYTHAGEVSLHASVRPRVEGICDLLIDVRDTGIGIEPAKQVQLFEPFFRASDAADAPQGTGLGLAIVRRLLALMKGEVELESTPGQGSQFRVLMRDVPISRELANPLVDDHANVDFGRLQPSRILIVDDVAWNRELLGAFLAEGEHVLAFASNGQEALAVAAEFDPELVLMDLRMPVMDGREANRRLREWAAQRAPTEPARSALAVIAVSASSMAREERLLSAEFEGYLRKPVSREVLFQALAEFIKLRPLQPAPTQAPAPKPCAGAIENANAADQNAAAHAGAEAVAQAQLELDAGVAAARAEVARRLRQIVEEDLQPLLGSMRIAEVRRLAGELVALGERGELPEISYFAQRLSAAVDRFDVLQMESLLNHLAEHVSAALPGGPDR
ncbi:ATP-binding protein [Aquimonas sp.]|jgi:signal transduction histidine kinase/DNA-binding NarL/FixJ family response regulator|uniref:ATP-binding protein n=1 Tax=Aquimonas sp. TaxID=1872588 RepID=UPI0037C12A25